MEKQQLKPIIEALILVSEEPISINDIMKIFQEEDCVDKSMVKEVLKMIEDDYAQNLDKGIRVREVGGGYQICTKPEMATWIQRLNESKPMRLSQAAMETLAIVAYRQPVVRADVEDIRGVDSGGVLKTLLERGLVKIVGRRDEAGNPLIYATTPQFMELFDLASMRDLPSLRDFDELQRERTGTVNAEESAQAREGEFIVEDQVVDVGETIWEDEEHRQIVEDLESGIKNLRELESDIFPKIDAAKQEQNDQPMGELDVKSEEGRQGESVQTQGTEEGTPSEDNRTGDGTV
ncbi:SMC-Scp complex subunit ScpB [bacterium]|nr:SMC-Scp complex subunit ScpB [bacterium]